MAKQDLYKTAQQSAKLFKLLKENQQLEGWVSAKISKAAEDISTVYQYLNYEKQFQDYSKMIAESTNLSDSKRSLLESKLAEAKEKVKELKKKAAKDKSEKMDEDKEMKVGDTKKTRTGELTKTSTGVIHKNTSYKDDGDEIASNAKSGKGIKSHAKAETAAEKKEKAPAQKFSPKGAKTWGMKDNEKFDNRDKVAEAKKSLKGDQKKLDVDGDKKIEKSDLAALRAGKKNEGTYLGKAMAEGKKCPICKKDPCGCGKSKKVAAKKVVKEAETVKSPKVKQLRTDGKVKEAIARAKIALEGKDKKKDKMDMEGNAFGKAVADAKKDGIQKGEKVKVGGKEVPLKESVELDRMKVLMTRLNG
jgi:hypothetical protein